MAMSDFEPVTSADWLRLAVGTLAQTSPGDVLASPSPAWGAKPSPARSSSRNQYPSGLHSHPFPELCLSLKGEPTMDLGEYHYTFAPPRLAVVDAGVMHSEGFSRKAQPYAVVWLSFQRESLLSHVSLYRAKRGWGGAARTIHRSADVARFRELLAEPLPELASDFDRLRAAAMEMLSEAYRAEVEREKISESTETDDGQQVQRAVVDWVREYLDSHFAEPVEIQSLAELTGYTPNYLNSLFREATGHPIHQYLTHRRMARARELCEMTTEPVQAIAEAVGYSDPLYFSRAFRKFHGVPPTVARRGG